jgi:ABC-2 type transport system permease protein
MTTQPHTLYWSVRRELWENRSLYIAPLAAVGLGLLAFFISLTHLLKNSAQALGAIDPTQSPVILAMPYSHTGMLATFTAIIVAMVYCLDALHGERRDRSILFWKSLPVSDRTTVLAKAMIPLVVLPLLVFAITAAAQLLILLVSTVAVLVKGGSVTLLWTTLPFVQLQVESLYSLVVLALWYAPVYAWLMLVSGWARRTVFLWAVLPLLAIAAVEHIVFHTSHTLSLMRDRLFGFAPTAYVLQMPDGSFIDPHFIPVSQLSPLRFLSTPDLWIGLIVAAALLAAAVRLRRYQEPI